MVRALASAWLGSLDASLLLGEGGLLGGDALGFLLGLDGLNALGDVARCGRDKTLPTDVSDTLETSTSAAGAEEAVPPNGDDEPPAAARP